MGVGLCLPCFPIPFCLSMLNVSFSLFSHHCGISRALLLRFSPLLPTALPLRSPVCVLLTLDACPVVGSPPPSPVSSDSGNFLLWCWFRPLLASFSDSHRLFGTDFSSHWSSWVMELVWERGHQGLWFLCALSIHLFSLTDFEKSVYDLSHVLIWYESCVVSCLLNCGGVLKSFDFCAMQIYCIHF